MSLYEVVKDAAKLAQQADNVDLIKKLLDVQAMALEMQEKQLQLNTKIVKLEQQIDSLKASKKFIFARGEKYLIDPEDPIRPLCPVCTPKLGHGVPMYNDDYCSICKISL